MDYFKTAICALLIAIATLSIITPLLHYVKIGWFAKRKDIMDGLSTEARLIYFQMFVGSAPVPAEETASEEFEALYEKWYGRRNFWVPGILIFVTSLIASAAVLMTALGNVGYIENPFISLPNSAVAALTGAYMWVSNDFVSRSRRLDFTSSDVRWGLLRLIIAVPMGYAFAAILPDSASLITFALGAFPLDTLTTMLRRITNKRLGVEEPVDAAGDDIIKLQGINRTIVERLYNEDVTTIVQIAYGDPVRLIMRSNLTFNFVTDCMSQALVWLYLKDDVNLIRPLGLRGAIEIKNLIDAYDNVDIEEPNEKRDHDQAVIAFPIIAQALKQTEATLQILFREIAEDPYTAFLHEVWSI